MTEYILTSKQMSIADELTIKNGIDSQQLMLQAGKSVFKNLPINSNGKALVACGPGNNGGDGYVIAKLLSNACKKVDVLAFNHGKELSIDNQFYDSLIPVSGANGIEWSKKLAQSEGIFTGISGGSSFAIAMQVAETAQPGSTILCMLPDTGERYLSSPLFEGVEEDMSQEEINLSNSTPGYQMPTT